jgi:hypothetical protein
MKTKGWSLKRLWPFFMGHRFLPDIFYSLANKAAVESAPSIAQIDISQTEIP